MGLELQSGLKVTTNTEADTWHGPYTDLAAARAAVPTSMRLYRTVKIIESDGVNEYVWKNGTADGDLVRKFGGVSTLRPIILCDVFDASAGLFPTTGGTGPSGGVQKGNQFPITGSGTLAGEEITAIKSVMALTDNPGQTTGNWQLNF